MIIDFKNLDRVDQLLREADFSIRNNDYEQAKEIAEEILELGYPFFASTVYKGIGNLERAREILVPVAEKLCREGDYFRAAFHYKAVDMIEEYEDARKMHGILYGFRKNAPFN
jgi:tetratricopeptide (TPR) repeat protein